MSVRLVSDRRRCRKSAGERASPSDREWRTDRSEVGWQCCRKALKKLDQGMDCGAMQARGLSATAANPSGTPMRSWATPRWDVRSARTAGSNQRSEAEWRGDAKRGRKALKSLGASAKWALKPRQRRFSKDRRGPVLEAAPISLPQPQTVEIKKMGDICSNRLHHAARSQRVRRLYENRQFMPRDVDRNMSKAAFAGEDEPLARKIV